jgi:REP element-mobilizing transposase RayT
MTAPRSQLVDPSTPGFYHCVSRCVRRAFLCGFDTLSGQDFEHRKHWIEDRLFELAGVFAVGVYAYAVMSNHLHVVVYLDPGASMAWSPEEVAERWLRLFPIRQRGEVDEAACRLRADVIAMDPVRVALYRERLSSLSWFMRCLSEPIARRANQEDACTGRFWEGRFKCQALLDDAAVLACMAYVDLNPIRAGLAKSLTVSEHTSVKRRMAAAPKPSEPLLPIAGHCTQPLRISHVDKRGSIPASTPSVVRQLGLDDRQWQAQVLGIESQYWRAVGAVDALIAKARAMGQCWLKGVGVAQRIRAQIAGM